MLANPTGTSKQDENNTSGKSQVSPPSLSLAAQRWGRNLRHRREIRRQSGYRHGSLTVPIYTSPGRSGFGPQLSLSYDSGAGNGPFGFGWSLALPSITRKTDKGLPQYMDAEESDIFILSGAEDLVPLLVKNNGQWVREVLPPRTVYGKQYSIHRYRPRVEGLFARIERWVNVSDPQDTFWRSISKDNITTWYGKTAESRDRRPDRSHPRLHLAHLRELRRQGQFHRLPIQTGKLRWRRPLPGPRAQPKSTRAALPTATSNVSSTATACPISRI